MAQIIRKTNESPRVALTFPTVVSAKKATTFVNNDEYAFFPQQENISSDDFDPNEKIKNDMKNVKTITFGSSY